MRIAVGLVLGAFALVGCSESRGSSDSTAGVGYERSSSEDTAGPIEDSSEAAPPAEEPIDEGTGARLTAGVWDDNLNYPIFEAYLEAQLQSAQPGLLPFELEDYEDANGQYADSLAAHQLLDVALVFDTTGSMSDELIYLQEEYAQILDELEGLYPDSQQRWSLLLYRDQGDQYVTKKVELAKDPADFERELLRAEAYGGGDFPEAADQALAEASALDWREGNQVARLIFWVADAPHHQGRADSMASAIRAFQQQGIHVYPVASSGIDEFTELTMRSTAQLTGGRYLFLTDDSGLGNLHKEPTIPCYQVTLLKDAMIRMVDIEMSGSYHAPNQAEVIRTVGNPEDGVCEFGQEKAYTY